MGNLKLGKLKPNLIKAKKVMVSAKQSIGTDGNKTGSAKMPMKMSN